MQSMMETWQGVFAGFASARRVGARSFDQVLLRVLTGAALGADAEVALRAIEPSPPEPAAAQPQFKLVLPLGPPASSPRRRRSRRTE